jgi:FeS assembly SUF system protein
MKKQKLGDQIIDVLNDIYDPEIPVSIYELGLIYDVKISDKNDVKVIMTLTSPSCPVAESLPEEIRVAVKNIKTVKSVEVVVTFEPPWEKSMMSEEAKLELGLL